MAANIQNELAQIELGDDRRKRRAARLAARLAATPRKSIRAACKGWDEAMGAFRLLHNGAVSPEKIFAAHKHSTLQRAGGCRRLLLIEDTTELDFTSHKALEGAGPLNTSSRRGFFAHSHLLVAEEEAVALGLCGSHIWARDDAFHGKSKERQQAAFEDKESYRWYAGYLKACELAGASGAEVAYVADRESDIYELFAESDLRKKTGGAHAALVVRALRNRALEKGGRLFQAVRQGDLLGVHEVEFPNKVQRRKVKGSRKLTHRKGRKAKLEVRSVRVRLSPPNWRKKGGPLPAVEIGAVGLFEIDPPEGQKPIEWIVLTDLPVDTLEQARRVIRIYTLRWLIEEFHRVLKSGCRVEQIALRDSASLLAAVALYMVVAWRILYLRDYGRADPSLCCSMFFTDAEWRAACLVLGKQTGPDPPTLGEMILLVGKIGGHMNRKKDPPPGAECLWRGLQQLRCYVEMGQALGAF